MCGLVGVSGGNDVLHALLTGLEALEYRGYDSAGVALSTEGLSGLTVQKTVGPVTKLAAATAALWDGAVPLAIRAGIGHTRWATHGRADLSNAHPHCVAGIAVAHNGIIENAGALRRICANPERPFISSTDSEVIPHLIAWHCERGFGFMDAVAATARMLEGRSAFVVLNEANPRRLIAVCLGSPLVVGRGAGRAAVASDITALPPEMTEVVSLRHGVRVIISDARVIADSLDASPFALKWEKRGEVSQDRRSEAPGRVAVLPGAITLREIAEQLTTIPGTIASLSGRIDAIPMAEVRRRIFTACGSSRYAAEIGAQWLRDSAKLSVEVVCASEFETIAEDLGPKDLVIGISQSGETADTLEALTRAKAAGAVIAAVVNVADSAMARLADAVLVPPVGREVGVAATKSFTGQLAALGLLAKATAPATRSNRAAPMDVRVDGVSSALESALALPVDGAAAAIGRAVSMLLVGKGAGFALACEGALKIKELAYLHAEAFPAGELKHGPLALVEEGLPCLAIVPRGSSQTRLLTAASELAARGARVLLLGPNLGRDLPADMLTLDLALPELPDSSVVDVIAMAVVLQRLAVAIARDRACPIDRPRNLAKSVTVI